MRGRPRKQEEVSSEECEESSRATSSNIPKELEDLVKALKNRTYRTEKEKRSLEDRVKYLRRVEARWAVKIKGTVGREIKRNLLTPSRRKRTTKTVKDILSGSEKSAWKNPRPWVLKPKTHEEGEKNEKGALKIARGKVGRSLIRGTIELAKERVKTKEYKQDFD